MMNFFKVLSANAALRVYHFKICGDVYDRYDCEKWRIKLKQMNEVAYFSQRQTIHKPSTKSTTGLQSLQQNEHQASTFMCRFCHKTFYNANALINHKTQQHDAEDSNSDYNSNDDQIDLSTFKFVPCAGAINDPSVVDNGLTTRVFSTDITYVVIKYEHDCEKTELRKTRSDAGKSRILKPVDLRGPFTCTFPYSLHPDMQCRQIFFNCCEYSKHYREAHTKRRKATLRCQVCEKRIDRCTSSSIKLNNNLMATHVPPPTQISFFCRMCGVTFLDSTDYDEHNRILHAKIKPYQCSLCAKRFTQQGGLQQHMRMHSGIRPFRCTFCPKAFTQKAGLEQHLRTHTKEKPFKCVVCSKDFSQSIHLRQHMRTHTNIQPFECSVCGRRFKQSSHLNFHLRSHLGNCEELDGDRMYYENIQQGSPIVDYINLANLHPVQHGETMYYAAELTTDSTGCVFLPNSDWSSQ